MSSERGKSRLLQIRPDLSRWDKYIDECDSIDLPEANRQDARNAFHALREELGEAFLENALANRHPIVANLLNRAPWTRKWFVTFSVAIQEMKPHGNYQSLLDRLRSDHRYGEALSVMEIACGLSEAGFDLAFDPPVVVEGHTKHPDLLLSDPTTGERSYTEVTVVHESLQAKMASETVRIVWERLARRTDAGSFCCRIFKILEGADLAGVLETLDESVNRIVHGEPSVEVINPAMEFLVVKRGEEDVLVAWGRPRGLGANVIIGPDHGNKELIRVLRKIREKQTQLPRDCPGIVVIHAPRLLLFAGEVDELIRELAAGAEAYRHLFAVIVLGSWLGPGEQGTWLKGQHFYLARRRLDVVQEKAVVVLNQAFGVPVSGQLRSRLIRGLGVDLARA